MTDGTPLGADAVVAALGATRGASIVVVDAPGGALAGLADGGNAVSELATSRSADGGSGRSWATAGSDLDVVVLWPRAGEDGRAQLRDSAAQGLPRLVPGGRVVVPLGPAPHDVACLAVDLIVLSGIEWGLVEAVSVSDGVVVARRGPALGHPTPVDIEGLVEGAGRTPCTTSGVLR